MFYVLVLFFVLSVLLLINNPKNKDTYKFVFIILSFLMYVFLETVAASKNSSYQYIGSPLYMLDYSLFTKLAYIKCSYYSLVNASIVCCLVYTAACSFFSYPFMIGGRNALRISVTAASCIIFVFFNSPSIGIRVYQTICRYDLSLVLLTWFTIVRNISCFILIAEVVINNIILHRYCRNTLIWLKRWHVNTYNIYQLFLNAVFSLLMLQNMIWPFERGEMKQNILVLGKSPCFMSGTSYMLLGIISFSASVFMLFSVFHYKTFSSVIMIKVKEYFLNRNAQKAKKQIRTYFHSFKNHLLAVESLCSRAIAAETPAQKDELLKKINTLSETSMASISAMLNALNRIDLDEHDDDIISCIETAIISANIPENISLIKHYNTNVNIVTFDYYHMTEMFKNIFCNAADAVSAAGGDDGEIIVEINADKDIFEISIRDNGIGMDKKTSRKMFRPLYTTKKKANDWGVGMFYVHKVVAAHGGFIRVLSSPGKGTQISVFFPI